MIPEPRPLRARLAALAAFVPVFEAPDFVFGSLSGRSSFIAYSPAAISFIKAAYENGWVEVYDWMDWSNSPRAKELLAHPSTIGSGTDGELEGLITSYVRANRFVEALLDETFRKGVLTAIVRRAQTLLADLPPPDSPEAA